MSKLFGALAAAAYIAVVVLANVLSTEYGMVSVGFGLVASAGTYAAGAALGLRDLVQDGLGRWGVLLVILIGSGLSYVLASEIIATASLAAFAASELCDLAVYTPLRERGWSRAVIASNVVGAVVDTYVFLSLAPFGPVTWHAMQGQLVGKILWATLLPVALIASVRKAREVTA
jgi:uncharacterized PurR-regulated membrane protein YhhQ (DUF165 family)